MKLKSITYRRIKKALVIAFLMIFSFSSFAADSINCICSAGKEVKKESKCCSQKKVKSCCEKKESNCPIPTDGKTTKKDCNDCGKCSFKKNDSESPANTNKPSSQINTPINGEKLEISFLLKNTQPSLGENWHPPDKVAKIFLQISNIRI